MLNVLFNFFTATSQVRVETTDDTQIEQFCGMNPFLGIHVFSDELSEVGLDNNYAWINILLECPDTKGDSCIKFDFELLLLAG